MDSLYQEEILDHFHNPRNNGALSDATHAADANNPTCGDTMHIDLIVKSENIADIKFSGEGCAISQAAASLLTEQVNDKPVSFLKSFDKTAMLELLGLELSPVRLKCGLLALECAQKAINK